MAENMCDFQMNNDFLGGTQKERSIKGRMLINGTLLKLKTFAIQRKKKLRNRKPQTGKTYLRNTRLIDNLHPDYVSNLRTQ